MVRSGQPLIARPDWIDRNPSSAPVSFFQSATDPHVETQRVTYTVPAGKKAIVTVAFMQLCRITAATTVGLAYLRFKKGIYDIAYVCHKKNAVGDEVHEALATNMLLLATEQVQILSYDGSTGGQFAISCSLNITEFDT